MAAEQHHKKPLNKKGKNMPMTEGEHAALPAAMDRWPDREQRRRELGRLHELASDLDASLAATVVAMTHLRAQVHALAGTVGELLEGDATANAAEIARLAMGVEDKVQVRVRHAAARVKRDVRGVEQMLEQVRVVRHRMLMRPFWHPSRMGEVPEAERAAIRVWFRELGPLGDGQEWDDDHAYFAETEARYASAPERVTERLGTLEEGEVELRGHERSGDVLRYLLAQVFQRDNRPFLAGDDFPDDFNAPVTFGQCLAIRDATGTGWERAFAARVSRLHCTLVVQAGEGGQGVRLRRCEWGEVRVIVREGEVQRRNVYLTRVWYIMENIFLGNDFPSDYDLEDWD